MSYTLASLREKSSRKLLVSACINIMWESCVVSVLGLCKFLPVRLFLICGVCLAVDGLLVVSVSVFKTLFGLA
jgi:hypothetical protein